MSTTLPAPLPAVGASFQLTRGIMPFLRLVTASDGSNAERVYVDPDGSDITVTESSISGGTRYSFAGTQSTTSHGNIPISITLDAVGNEASGYDLSVSSASVGSSIAIDAIGIALEASASNTATHYLLSPVFSGIVFEEPHDTIQSQNDLGTAASMQAMCYWSDDGTGLYIQGLDDTGHVPKYFRFEPINSAADLRIVVGFWLPGAETGGQAKSTAVDIRIRPYHYRTDREAGWEPAAKAYRNWLEANATTSGKLLEQGRFEDRSDTPTWLKELELFVTDIASWYPGGATVSDPYEELTAHQTELECTNVLLALWAAHDTSTDTGKVGTFYPKSGLVSQFATLDAADIKCSVYTWPHAFDTENSALSGLTEAYVTDQAGVQVTEAGGSGETYAVMDVAESIMATHYGDLADYFVANFNVSGFYTDLPVTAFQPDYSRSEGLETGISKDGVTGFIDIHEAMTDGGDFAIFHEACFEWLVRSSTMGQGTTSTYARTYPQETRTYAVPFFQTVYSGYCAFWPADPALGTQTLATVPTAYGPFTEFNISRLQAEGAVLGGIPNTSEVYMPEGKMFYEKTVGDTSIDNWLQHHKATLKSAVALRNAARDHLVYGQMLGDPSTSDTDTASMTLNVYYLSLGTTAAESYTKNDVHTRVWKADDGSARVIAFNGTNSSATSKIDMAKVGYPEARTLRDVSSNELFEATPASFPSKGQRFEFSVGAASYRVLEVVA